MSLSNRDLAALPPSFPTARYEVQEFIGEGSRKRVFLAHDTRLDRPVAVAFAKTEGLDQIALDRVQREAREMGCLGDHPNIVTVYDIGDADSQPYIVLQFMGGGDVQRLLERSPGHRLPIVRAIEIAERVCAALEHAHARGVVHRDVKPDNVWLTESGVAHLGDFGLALRRERPRLTSEGVIVGTFAYMAPEQALGRPPEPRSDLYALGAMLYEMVTGRPPFVGDDPIVVVSQHINAAPVAPSWHNPEVPNDLEVLILQLLAKVPDDRPLDASVVRTALAAISLVSRGAVSQRERGENPIARLAGGIFVGRAEEMEELRAGVMESLAGHGRLVLLGGEPGIGKTSIAQEVATYARLAGVQVLWGRCDETGGAPPYWPWIQVIRSYVHDSARADVASVMGSGAADIVQVVPEVGCELPEPSRPPPIDSEQARFRLFDSIARFLRNAGRRQPLLLIVDDLHAADTPSLLLLQFLTRQIGDMHLMVVAAYRDVEVGREHPLFHVLGELVRESVTRRLTLHGLSERDVGRYIELSTGMPSSPALVAAVSSETEGNPFFVGEVVRLLASEGRLDVGGTWRSAIPQGVREVIGRRLDRLSPECNRMLVLASVVGREFGVSVLERAGDSPRHQLLHCLEEALSARVIGEVPAATGRYVFSHGLFRETLYGELTTTQRVELHRRVGEALEGIFSVQPEPHLAELAHHFFAAAPGGATEKAVRYALGAGHRAASQMAHEEAARHYEMALQILEVTDQPDGSHLVDVLLLLSEALWRAGEVQQAKATSMRAIDMARHLGAPEQFARAALGFAGQLPAFGAVDPDENVIAVLEEALRTLNERDSAIRALVLARLAEEQTLSAAHEPRWSLARQAIEMARRIGDPAVRAAVLRRTCYAYWNPTGFDERLALSDELIPLADQIHDRTLGLEGHILRFLALAESGNPAPSQRALDVCERMAKELRQPYHQFFVAMLRGCMAMMQGRLGEVEGLVQEAVVLGEKARTQNAPLFCGTQLARLMWLQGRFEELEPLLIGFSGLYPSLAPAMNSARAVTYSEQGRAAEARVALDRIGDPDSIPYDLSWQSTVAHVAEASATLRDVRRAERLYEMIRPLDGRNMFLPPSHTLGPAAYFLAILAAAMDRWEQAASHFEDALQMDANGARQHRARTQVAYADMLIRRGRPADAPHALEMLNQATVTASELAMARLVERARELAARIGGSVPPWTQPVAPLPLVEPHGLDKTPLGGSGEGSTVLFRLEGEYWTIAQQDTVLRVKSVKGLHYLAQLLRYPGREFHALELVSAAAKPGAGRGAERKVPIEVDERALDLGGPGALLDETAKAQYRDRIAALREQLAEAEAFNDTDRAGALRSEIGALAQQLAAAVGLDGRNRSAGSSAERARLAVTKGIKAAVSKVRANHPSLGRYLATHVRTGYVCSYAPDPDRPIRWVF